MFFLNYFHTILVTCIGDRLVAPAGWMNWQELFKRAVLG
jgi:hypothetical protein